MLVGVPALPALPAPNVSPMGLTAPGGCAKGVHDTALIFSDFKFLRGSNYNMIPEFKKGDTVMWCPDDYPFEASVGILLGFYDEETDEELPTQYDACNVLVNALVHFPWGQSMLAPLHELLPLQDYIKRQSYIEEQRTKIFC